MEIKRFKIGDTEFEFVCEGWETYRAWGHEVHLFKNGYEISSYRIRYYNRTWECYRFQSCMLCAVETAMDKIMSREIENYKYRNNIERFKKGEKQRVIEDVRMNNEDYKALIELENEVHKR